MTTLIPKGAVAPVTYDPTPHVEQVITEVSPHTDPLQRYVRVVYHFCPVGGTTPDSSARGPYFLDISLTIPDAAKTALQAAVATALAAQPKPAPKV